MKHGDPIEKVSVPSGITINNKIRRTNFKREEDSVGFKPPSWKGTKGGDKRKKGVTFGISDEDHSLDMTTVDI
jgi:hypothetical protein